MAEARARNFSRLASTRNAPGLTDDAPAHGRGGTNPNAPFTLIDRTPRAAAHLASMTAKDAYPCTGKELTVSGFMMPLESKEKFKHFL